MTAVQRSIQAKSPLKLTATELKTTKLKRRARSPPFSENDLPGFEMPGQGEELHPGANSLLGLLGLFRLLRFFSLLRFLSHSILIGF
jgi:hypothetical protein